MVEERLAIHNFGPIQAAEIEAKDLTIFVGPQATGKSLAAQALCFLRGIERNFFADPSQDKGPVEIVLSELGRWFGNSPSVYAGLDARLCWEQDKAGKKTTHEIGWDSAQAYLGDELEKKVLWWEEAKREDESPHMSRSSVAEKLFFDSPVQVYIPAGRTLYSFIPPYTRVYASVASAWPGYVLAFHESLGSALRRLWSREQEKNKMYSVASQETDFVQRRIDTIMKGQIQFGPDTILLEVGKNQLPPTTIAAGQMEMWPFWTIVKAGLAPGTQVYLEEPEAHLHPGAQRSVMEIIAYLVRSSTRFLLTTHSPYILYAVNNFLMAHKVLDAGKVLPGRDLAETALRPEQVAAYRFSSDGTVHDIMDRTVGLIDEDELDCIADDLGATFTQLQERLAGVE